MVLPAEDKIIGQTLEDRLAHKFDDLQVAREDHQDGLFDEISKSIEVLMKAVPQAFEDLMRNKACAQIGKVTKDEKLLINGLDGKVVVDTGLAELRHSWKKTLSMEAQGE